MPTRRWVSIRAVGVLLRLSVAVGLLLFAVGEALAQGDTSRSSGAEPLSAEFGTPAAPGPDQQVPGMRNFGVADGIDHWVGSPEFASRDGSPLGSDGGAGGYIFNNGGTATHIFWAQLHLPQGALLSGLRLYYCDTNAGSNPRLFLTTYEEGVPTFRDVFTFDPALATPGCTSVFFDTDSGGPGSGHTIDLRNPADRFYVINIRANANDNTIRWKGVRAFWFRQVSPAPAAATFNDVGTGHTFFQFIEALADAGITSGCGGGNYCPDDPVTRGQMAVFLSRALGLHWPAN